MKQLITKSDGTPTKSKVHALQFLEKMGIDKTYLIEENGQFYYIPSPQPSPEMGEGEQLREYKRIVGWAKRIVPTFHFLLQPFNHIPFNISFIGILNTFFIQLKQN